MGNKQMSKKKIYTIAILLFLAVAGTVYGISTLNKSDSENTKVEEKIEDAVLSLECNEDISADFKDEIVIPVKLSYLPSGIYPSASISVEFDKDKLEFIGIKDGTMENYSKEIPKWNVDVESSNKYGVVNAIYLDESGGKNSYYKSGFVKGEKDTVLNLKFKLKDSVKQNDKLELTVSDAVFATINGDTDDKNLSTLKETMEVKNLTIEVK